MTSLSRAAEYAAAAAAAAAALSGVNDTNAISSLWAAAGSGRAVSGSDSTGHRQVTAPLGNPGHRAHTTSSN